MQNLDPMLYSPHLSSILDGNLADENTGGY